MIDKYNENGTYSLYVLKFKALFLIKMNTAIMMMTITTAAAKTTPIIIPIVSELRKKKQQRGIFSKLKDLCT